MRARAISSVSSVNGVGANSPVPPEIRAVHDARPFAELPVPSPLEPAKGRTSADSRGLTTVPYTLCASMRALDVTPKCSPGVHVCCAKSAGASKV